jgi:hypothetical protein
VRSTGLADVFSRLTGHGRVPRREASTIYLILQMYVLSAHFPAQVEL